MEVIYFKYFYRDKRKFYKLTIIENFIKPFYVFKI